MSTFYQEVLRITHKYKLWKKHSTPIRRETLNTSSYLLRNFSGFLVNDEHNASKKYVVTNRKVRLNPVIVAFYATDYSNSGQK